MIYEFTPSQDLHGWPEPWAPGSGPNQLDFANMIFGEPSNTATVGSTPRLWTELTIIKGLATSNYYQPTLISSAEKTVDTLTFTSTNASYGVALVFPELEIGEEYIISAVVGASIPLMSVLFYSEEGALLTSTASTLILPITFTVPEDTKYTLLVARPQVNNTSITIKNIMLEKGDTASAYKPYANVCMPEGFNIWDPEAQDYTQVYAGYVNANTRELYLRPVYEEYAGEELVGPWMSSWDPYEEDTTPTEGAFVIDFGGELTSFEITPFMLQTLLDSLGIRQHFTNGAGLLNSLMDQAQGRVRSEEELLHLSRPLNVIAIGDQLPAGLTFKPISKDVLPGLPGKFIR